MGTLGFSFTKRSFVAVGSVLEVKAFPGQPIRRNVTISRRDKWKCDEIKVFCILKTNDKQGD